LSATPTTGAEKNIGSPTRQTFGHFGFADAFSAPVVGEYADVTARQSVTHLTFANPFGRSVPTFFGSITHRGGRDTRVPVPRRFAAFNNRAAQSPERVLQLPSLNFL
jgi:hypothetical protein